MALDVIYTLRYLPEDKWGSKEKWKENCTGKFGLSLEVQIKRNLIRNLIECELSQYEKTDQYSKVN